MSDHTPTTEEILDCYIGQLVETSPNTFQLVDEKTARVEFSRWLIAERKRVAEMATQREQERITALWEIEMQCPCEEAMQHLATRIKEQSPRRSALEELQGLSEETGEYESFDNPLIDEEYNRLDNPIIGGV